MGGAFQSVSLKPGESFSHRFDEAGAYQYMCKQHSRQGMWGKITVQ
ncbi:MAG: plastocyanin/azurin family copper-binding protein [Chloroflexota bacterium]|nr:plastocyanin/azurin family copper-binding protein [Chloroflexota bacterium]